jgi:hypothetical protein
MGGFKWKVPVAGYRWIPNDDGTPAEFEEEAREREGRFCLEPVTYVFEEFEPFGKPALFRIFAATEPSRGGVLTFANEYGHLGDDAKYPEDFRAPRKLSPLWDAEELEDVSEREKLQLTRDWLREQRFIYSLPEPLSRWTAAIEAMRQCVNKWDSFQSGNVEEDAVQALLEEINEQLVFETELMVKRVEKPPMLKTPKKSPNLFRLEFVPAHLLAALWLQLAQAVADNKGFRQCLCGTWFEIAGEFRTSRIYCSDACKSQAYRDRKTKAV